MNEIIKSYLKQQVIDENGLYCWENKYFKLIVNKALLLVYNEQEEVEEGEDDEQQQQQQQQQYQYQEEEENNQNKVICRLSLIGSKYAKEWSLSTSFIGSYGFDIIWSTGRIWSFLAEDEFTCRKWVESINQSIQNNPIQKIELQKEKANERNERNESKVTFQDIHHNNDINTNDENENENENENHSSNFSLNQSNGEDLSKTMLENLTPEKNTLLQTPRVTKLPSTVPRYGNNENINYQNYFDQQQQQQQQQQQSYLSSIPVQSSPSDLSPESNLSDQQSQQSQSNQPNQLRTSKYLNRVIQESGGIQTQPFNKILDQELKNEEIANEKFQIKKSLQQQQQQQQNQSKNHINFEEDEEYQINHQFYQQQQQQQLLQQQKEQITYLTERCQFLNNLSEKYRKEIDVSSLQIEQIREEWSQKYSLLENKLHLMTEKEIRNNTNYHKDIENTMIRIQSESQSIHEATMKTLQEQHRREINCLNEELNHEKKKYGQLLLNEKSQRDMLESNEIELRQQIQELQIKFELSEKKLNKQEKLFQFEKEKWLKQKEELERVTQEEMEILRNEKEEIRLKCQQEIKNKITELSLRFNHIQSDMENTLRETVRHEIEEEKYHQLIAIEKKCQEDIEAAKQEERKKHQIEINKIKETFLLREKETTDDLMNLEVLHSDHINKLREEIKQYQQQLTYLSNENKQIKMSMLKKEEEQHKEIELFNKKLQDQLERSNALELSMKQIQDEANEAKGRESIYRDKLGKLIEENRIQHSEIMNLQRQCGIDAAMAQSWKAASKESELSISSYEASLRIAREEIAMLEHGYKRIEEENKRLKEALHYADTIVYGNSTLSNKKNNYNHNNHTSTSTTRMSGSNNRKLSTISR